MFNSIEDFRHEVSDVDKQLRGTLNIGIIDNTITNMDSPLPSAISRFNQRASDVQIQIEVKPPLELEQSVLHGRMHAAIWAISNAYIGPRLPTNIQRKTIVVLQQ